MEPAKNVIRFGHVFPPGTDLLTAELLAYKHGYTIEEGGLGKAVHFKRIVKALWGPGSKREFIWHPWADDMNEASCAHRYLAVNGSGSSGKTQFFAIKAIVEFLCAPHETLVLVTSTSLKEARRRIWGSILDYWMACPGLPGKVVDSQGLIRFQVGNEAKFSDRCGIALLPSEKKQEREAVGKLIGLHQNRVVFIGDEMPELSEAILEAAYTNLCLNPEFWLYAIGNFKSVYDAFGQFCKPKGGYNSITVDDKTWETERGLCLHLDALKSPNWLAGKNEWPIIKVEDIQGAIDHEGTNSPGFWRMFRAFPCPSGSEQSIYTEADLIKFDAEKKPYWDGVNLTRMAGLDPSFVNGGDDASLVFGWYGKDIDGRMVICADKTVTLKEDTTKKDEPRNFQIARQFKEECIKEGVLPENAALDATGAGGPFADIVSEVWSPLVARCFFGGKASELPFSAIDNEPASKKCANRVTELWYIGLEFLRNRQLKGIFPALAKEMCAREYGTQKTGDMKLIVERKEDMRSRTGKSPNIADAFFVMLDHCRVKFGAVPGGQSGLRKNPQGNTWKGFVKKWQPRIRRLT